MRIATTISGLGCVTGCGDGNRARQNSIRTLGLLRTAAASRVWLKAMTPRYCSARSPESASSLAIRPKNFRSHVLCGISRRYGYSAIAMVICGSVLLTGVLHVHRGRTDVFAQA